MDARLPAHVEVSGLIRAVESAGGFATVLSKGERDAGVILILTIERGRNARLYERMPTLDGKRAYRIAKEEDPENKEDFQDYVERRRRQDSDSWIIEVDIADAERFIASLPR